MTIAKGRVARDGIAMFLDRCRCRNGQFSAEAILGFSAQEIRPLYDGARLLDKWSDRVDDPIPVRAAVRALDDTVARCKGPDGKVAATGWVDVSAEEAESLKRACRLLTEYVGELLAAAEKRSRKSDRKT